MSGATGLTAPQHNTVYYTGEGAEFLQVEGCSYPKLEGACAVDQLIPRGVTDLLLHTGHRGLVLER